jgi:hypothetical protein
MPTRQRSAPDDSSGGSGGLGDLIGAFQRKGLGDVISGWISTGPNPPIPQTAYCPIPAIATVCLSLMAISCGSHGHAPTGSASATRELTATEDDLRILVKADEILKDESVWNRHDDRVCDDDEAAGKRSLFCALQRACVDVLGKYEHRRVALEEVRSAVEDATRGRDFEHRLRDFNNLPETRFGDVKDVLRVATDRVKSRLRKPAP